MNILNLYKGAIISIESREGRKKVWIHMGNQRYPLVNRADLEVEMAPEAPNWDFNVWASLGGEATGIHNN
jgi:hypothetical protein